MTTRALIVAVAATASLAACGAAEDPSTAADGSEAANRKAMLDFSRCMRQNGVEMPDPQFEGGGQVLQKGPAAGDPDKLRAAEKACAKYRDTVKPPELSDEQKDEFRKAALANARCMREHGINLPDPTFDESGRATLKLDRRNGVDPESPKFEAARKACERTLPRLREGDSTSGGER